MEKPLWKTLSDFCPKSRTDLSLIARETQAAPPCRSMVGKKLGVFRLHNLT